MSPPWHSYFLCGLKGVLEVLPEDSVGMLVAVTGNVPHSAGLSSSSALVSAAVLAATHANGVRMSSSLLHLTYFKSIAIWDMVRCRV